MSNYSKMIMVSIAGLVLASYGGEFTLKKADHDLLLKRRMLAWEIGPRPLKEPRIRRADTTHDRSAPRVHLSLPPKKTSGAPWRSCPGAQLEAAA